MSNNTLGGQYLSSQTNVAQILDREISGGITYTAYGGLVNGIFQLVICKETVSGGTTSYRYYEAAPNSNYETTWATRASLTYGFSITTGLVLPFRGPQSRSREIGEFVQIGCELSPTDPRNSWLIPCDGREIYHTDEQNYDALFQVIRYQFGGDGATWFKLPDANSRGFIGAGTLPIGSQLGEAAHTLTQAELPNVSPRMRVDASTVGIVQDPTGRFLAMGRVGSNAVTIYKSAPLASPTFLASDAIEPLGSGESFSLYSPNVVVGVYIVYA